MLVWRGLGILTLLVLIIILALSIYIPTELAILDRIEMGWLITTALLLNFITCNILQKLLTRYVPGTHTLYDLTPAQWGKGILIVWLILYALSYFVELFKN